MPTNLLEQYIASRTWDMARERLASPHGEEEAANENVMLPFQGGQGHALHLACSMRPLPPVSFVKELLQKFPKAAFCAEREWGLLPLHYASSLWSIKPTFPKTKRSSYNQSSGSSLSSFQTSLDEPSLHDEFYDEGTNHLEIIKHLLTVNPEGAQTRERFSGMLPIHIAATTSVSVDGKVHLSSPPIIEALMKAWPAAAAERDGWGESPLDISWRGQRWNCRKCRLRYHDTCHGCDEEQKRCPHMDGLRLNKFMEIAKRKEEEEKRDMESVPPSSDSHPSERETLESSFPDKDDSGGGKEEGQENGSGRGQIDETKRGMEQVLLSSSSQPSERETFEPSAEANDSPENSEELGKQNEPRQFEMDEAKCDMENLPPSSGSHSSEKETLSSPVPVQANLENNKESGENDGLKQLKVDETKSDLESVSLPSDSHPSERKTSETVVPVMNVSQSGKESIENGGSEQIIIDEAKSVTKSEPSLEDSFSVEEDDDGIRSGQLQINESVLMEIASQGHEDSWYEETDSLLSESDDLEYSVPVKEDDDENRSGRIQINESVLKEIANQGHDDSWYEETDSRASF